MDEIVVLRTFAPNVSPATTPEIALARTAMLAHIARRTAPRRAALLPALRRSSVLALAAILIAGIVSMVGAAVYFGEWGPVNHPATPAVIDGEISSTIAVTPLPAGHTYPIAAIRARAEPAGNLTLFAGVQQVQFYAMCAWTGSTPIEHTIKQGWVERMR
jgi:hypothetical protein